jgi:LysR family glycine cleavage system transcriptional activator
MRLPPLNALRAFEAAARHGSFSRAAEELHVTQGAVSRHVKLLEEHLGVALFRRRPQGISLSEPGSALLPELTAAFGRIGRAVRRTRATGGEIRVIAACTFASRWLVPRLGRLQERYPAQRVSTGLFWTGDYADYHDGGFDVGVSFHETTKPRPGDLDMIELWQEALTPVCAPQLLQGRKPLACPADLAGHALLHPSEDRVDWAKWLRAAGVAESDAERGQTFATMEMAVGAAIGGVGVAIADLHLIREELASGRLVAPFTLTVQDGSGYLLFTERGRFQEPKIASFRDWLLAEAQTCRLP